jgi:hypothetical protein
MDYDDEDLADFQFSSSQESKIEPPLVIDSVWECPGITLDTIEDDDGKTILGWHCGYCLIPGNRGGSRFFKRHDASHGFVAPYKGEGYCNLYRLAEHLSKCCPCPNRIEIFQGK